QHQRSPGVGDYAVLMIDHEMPGGLTDVDAVITVGRMPEDPLILFIKSVHGPPCERDPRPELPGVLGQLDMLPCSSRRAALAATYGVPGRKPEVGMLRCVFSALERVGKNVALREVRDGIAAGLEQHEGVLAIGNPRSAETHPRAPAQRLDV